MRNYEIDEVEYLEKAIEDLTQIDEHSAAYFNIKNAETKNNDKENTFTNNAACNSNENSNDSYSTTSIIKKRKRKFEKVQSTQQSTQNLTNIAQKTYEIQNSYYDNKLLLKKRELKLKDRLVNIAEKCNPS